MIHFLEREKLWQEFSFSNKLYPREIIETLEENLGMRKCKKLPIP